MDLTKFKESVKEKASKAKEKGRKIWEGVSKWARENPDQAASAIGTAVFASGAFVVNTAKKKKEFDSRECRQWDPVTGQYFYIKRPLTNREKLEVSRRMKNGETKADILLSLNVL